MFRTRQRYPGFFSESSPSPLRALSEICTFQKLPISLPADWGIVPVTTLKTFLIMAKGIDINGQLRGKRGGLVYYRALGEQISRTRNTSPRNPRTTAQAYQRMVFATVGGARALLAPIVNHSFEGVAYGTRSLAEFQRVNTKKMRAAALDDSNYANFLIKGASTMAPNAYQVSRGSLSAPSYAQFAGSAQQNYRMGVVLGVGYSVINVAVADAAAYDAVLAALKCVQGDQLTLLLVTTSQAVAAEYNAAKNYVADATYSRITFKNWDEATMAGENFIEDGKINPVFIARLDGEELLIGNVQSTGGEAAVFAIQKTAEDSFAGAALIRSRVNEMGKWLRSTAFLRVPSTQQAAAQDVWPSYTDVPQQNFDSDRILNNAIVEGSSTASYAPVLRAKLGVVSYANNVSAQATELARGGNINGSANSAPALGATLLNAVEGVEYKLAIKKGDTKLVYGTFSGDTLALSAAPSGSGDMGQWSIVLLADNVVVDTYGTLTMPDPSGDY